MEAIIIIAAVAKRVHPITILSSKYTYILAKRTIKLNIRHGHGVRKNRGKESLQSIFSAIIF